MRADGADLCQSCVNRVCFRCNTRVSPQPPLNRFLQSVRQIVKLPKALRFRDQLGDQKRVDTDIFSRRQKHSDVTSSLSSSSEHKSAVPSLERIDPANAVRGASEWRDEEERAKGNLTRWGGFAHLGSDGGVSYCSFLFSIPAPN